MNGRLWFGLALAFMLTLGITLWLQWNTESPRQSSRPPALVVTRSSAPLSSSAVVHSSPPIPPVIRKIVEAARRTPMNRTMDLVIKNWFGCRHQESYEMTINGLQQHDPIAAEHLNGTDAECVVLKAGQKVDVLDKDVQRHQVRIRIDAVRDEYWTDPSALGDRSATQVGE